MPASCFTLTKRACGVLRCRAPGFDSSVDDKAGAVLSPFDPSIPERQLHAGVEACHAGPYRWLISGNSRIPGGGRMTLDWEIEGDL